MENYLKQHENAKLILQEIELINIQIQDIKEAIKRNTLSDGRVIMPKLIQSQKKRREKLYYQKNKLKDQYLKKVTHVLNLL